jgi:GNAT superfamily N-acetyltransferase
VSASPAAGLIAVYRDPSVYPSAAFDDLLFEAYPDYSNARDALREVWPFCVAVRIDALSVKGRLVLARGEGSGEVIIEWLATSPRGGGLGRSIFAEVIKRADSLGVTLLAIPLGTADDPPRLKRFYRDLGFIETNG